MKLYKKLMTKDAKPFGSVSTNIVSVNCVGFVAVVKTIETIGAGEALKTARNLKNFDREKSSKVILSNIIIIILRTSIE